MTFRSSLQTLVAAALALGAAAPARSVTALSEVRVSPDTTLMLGAPIVNDEDVAADNLSGTVSVVSIGAIPAEAELDAYAVRPHGEQLLSFSTTVLLPGGATARPGDVWRYDGVTYALEFDAAAVGLPDGANVDAVAVYGSALLLSFDVSLDIGAVHFEPEDLVLFDGATFSVFFDGSVAGIAPGLDLDAADYLACDGHLLLSFDGSGTIGGVAFDDEDVLEYDRSAIWEMAYDGDAHDADWSPADLAAIQATVNLGPGPPVVFGQTVTVDSNKSTLRWPSAVSFRAVRGPFSSFVGIGAYAVNATVLGTGNSMNDSATPAAGTGFWYLVKRGGCSQTSWQSVLGLEPGRDTSIP